MCLLNATKYRVLIAAAIVMLLMAPHCLSQDILHDHSCTVDGAGIFSIPEGQDRQNFSHGGWGLQGGGGFEVSRSAEPSRGHMWYITGNYLYNKFRVRASALAEAVKAPGPPAPDLSGALSAHGSFSVVTLDPTLRVIPNSRYNLYWSGGFGWLHRGIGFNGLNMIPPLLPSGSSLYRVASNSGVFDFGMGVNFVPRSFHGFMPFAEARVYHGAAINSGSTLVPISVGVRW
jgi:hypothetical protein